MVAAGLSVVPKRRFPPPWSVDEPDPKLQQQQYFIVPGDAARRRDRSRGSVGWRVDAFGVSRRIRATRD
jgi:hypothetical protein